MHVAYLLAPFQVLLDAESVATRGRAQAHLLRNTRDECKVET